MNMIGGGVDGMYEKHIYDGMHINNYHLYTLCWLVNMYMLIHTLFQIQIRIFFYLFVTNTDTYFFYIYVLFPMYPMNIHTTTQTYQGVVVVVCAYMCE